MSRKLVSSNLFSEDKHVEYICFVGFFFIIFTVSNDVDYERSVFFLPIPCTSHDALLSIRHVVQLVMWIISDETYLKLYASSNKGMFLHDLHYLLGQSLFT